MKIFLIKGIADQRLLLFSLLRLLEYTGRTLVLSDLSHLEEFGLEDDNQVSMGTTDIRVGNLEDLPGLRFIGETGFGKTIELDTEYLYSQYDSVVVATMKTVNIPKADKTYFLHRGKDALNDTVLNFHKEENLVEIEVSTKSDSSKAIPFNIKAFEYIDKTLKQKKFSIYKDKIILSQMSAILEELYDLPKKEVGKLVKRGLKC